jgi:hypothetical protein
MAMRKKKKAAKKSKAKARKPARKRAAPKKKAAAKKPDAGAALAAFAKKIVKVTQSHGDFMALYSPDVVSEEAAGEPVRGFDGLAQKMKGWEQMQEGTTWTARSVATDPRSGTIVIEWDCQVKLRGGPTVPMKEVAIHQVKNGKIVAERYYYDPASLQPAATTM